MIHGNNNTFMRIAVKNSFQSYKFSGLHDNLPLRSGSGEKAVPDFDPPSPPAAAHRPRNPQKKGPQTIRPRPKVDTAIKSDSNIPCAAGLPKIIKTIVKYGFVIHGRKSGAAG
jgi:hypothetical protein